MDAEIWYLWSQQSDHAGHGRPAGPGGHQVLLPAGRPPWPREVARGEALAPGVHAALVIFNVVIIPGPQIPCYLPTGRSLDWVPRTRIPGPLCGSRSAFPVLLGWQPPGVICPSLFPFLGTLARCAGLLEPACVIVAASPATRAALQAGAGASGAGSARGWGRVHGLRRLRCPPCAPPTSVIALEQA